MLPSDFTYDIPYICVCICVIVHLIIKLHCLFDANCVDLWKCSPQGGCWEFLFLCSNVHMCGLEWCHAVRVHCGLTWHHHLSWVVSVVPNQALHLGCSLCKLLGLNHLWMWLWVYEYLSSLVCGYVWNLVLSYLWSDTVCWECGVVYLQPWSSGCEEGIHKLWYCSFLYVCPMC
jgi:hypothetical protein